VLSKFGSQAQSAIDIGRVNGNIYGMKTTIDDAGRLVLPKSVREALNLEGGVEVEVRIAGDHIEIEAVSADISIVKEGAFLVAVPKEARQQKISVEEVERVRQQIINERQDH
jgi:AbrB family looped-hinge helix DNA binding protein